MSDSKRSYDSLDSGETCRDYLKGTCSRGSNCKYTHAAASMSGISGDGQICQDFLRGACNRIHCKYLHPSAGGASSPTSAANSAASSASAMNAFYNYYAMLSGLGTSSIPAMPTMPAMPAMPGYAAYPYYFPTATAPSVPSPSSLGGDICKDNLKGMCNRANCKFVHLNNAYQSGTSDQSCRDYLKGACNRSNCKFKHEIPNTSETCKDFLNGRCDRPNCKYTHSASPSLPATNYTFCKDFMNGQCDRPNCKFVHATKEEEAEFKATGKLSARALTGRTGVVAPTAYPALTAPIIGEADEQGGKRRRLEEGAQAYDPSNPSVFEAQQQAYDPANATYQAASATY